MVELSLQYYQLEDNQCQQALVPVATTLRDISYRVCIDDSAEADYIPDLVGPLRHLRRVQLPLPAIALDGVVAALNAGGRLDPLELKGYDGNERAEELLDLLACLQEVMVGRLALWRRWWHNRVSRAVCREDRLFGLLRE